MIRPDRRSAVVTIIGTNYLSRASTLYHSVRLHEPAWDFFTVVVNNDAGHDLSPVGIGHALTPEDLDMRPLDLAIMSVLYNITEFCTAIKPSALLWLLDQGYDHVYYLDPDTKLYAGLHEVTDQLHRHSVVLTPHSLSPMPDDGREPSHDIIRACGSFNLGFFAGSAAARPLMEWWAEMLVLGAGTEPEHNRFTDQRWMDQAPSYADVHVLRHPGYNVAYWNLHERRLRIVGDNYLVNDAPLKFFHFSGYDIQQPWRLTKYAPNRPRVRLTDSPALGAICESYRRELVDWENDPTRQLLMSQPYLRAALGGLPELSDVTRRGLRDILRHETIAGADPLRSVKDADARDVLERWIWESPSDAPEISMPRLAKAIWSARADLQSAFPDPYGASRHGFLDWLEHSGRSEASLPADLLTFAQDRLRSLARSPSAETKVKAALNLVGYFESQLGVGEAGRKVLSALQQSAMPLHVQTTLRTPAKRIASTEVTSAAPGEVTLWCVNADQLPLIRQSFPDLARKSEINIGYWWWELEQLDPAFTAAIQLVDEVWAPTSFVYDNLRVLAVPVRKAPLLLDDRPICSDLNRSDFELPDDRPVFLARFDFFSSRARKNPEGAIAAFRRAFPRPGEAFLLVKTSNGEFHPKDLDELAWSVRDRPDIRVWDTNLGESDNHALTKVCSAFVSLHRAEGLGYNIAEAMALGKPVIATGYSGNLDFCTPQNSYLLPFRRVAVSDSTGTYSARGEWADPDIASAAAAMREIVESPTSAKQRGELAERDINRLSDPTAFALFARARIAALQSRRCVPPLRHPRATTPAIPSTREVELLIPEVAMQAKEPPLHLPPVEDTLGYGKQGGMLRRLAKKLVFKVTASNLHYTRLSIEAAVSQRAHLVLPSKVVTARLGGVNERVPTAPRRSLQAAGQQTRWRPSRQAISFAGARRRLRR